jgi:alkane 1-monooxygenase
MKIQALKYLFVYIVPVVVIFSISSSGIWTFTALILLFGILPFLELFTKGSTENMTQVEEDMALKNIGYDLLLYSLVPIQYFTVVYFLYSISDEHLTLASKIGMTIAMGLSCGVLGINAAHELGHRSTWYEQLMSKMLLLTSMYMHFFIEHNRGHHKNVSTDEDPASAKYGENIYRFYVRTITESWISAWRLEIDRLNKSGFSFGLFAMK